MNGLEQMRLLVKGLSVYREAKPGPLAAFERLVDCLEGELVDIVQAYSAFYHSLIGKENSASFPDFLFGFILTATNPFSLQCAKGKFYDTESSLRVAVKGDLDSLERLSKVKASHIKEMMFARFGEDNQQVLRLPEWASKFTKFQVSGSFSDNLIAIAEHYQDNGCGFFSIDKTFDVTPAGGVVPMEGVPKVRKGEVEEDILHVLRPIFKNISQGQGENCHIMGDAAIIGRGVLGCLQEESSKGMKLVNLPKASYAHFAKLCDMFSHLPGYFLIAPDDFSALEKDFEPELARFFSTKQGVQVKGHNLFLLVNEPLQESSKQWFSFSLRLPDWNN